MEINEKGVIGEYVGSAFTLPACPTVQAAVMRSNSFGRVIRTDAEKGSKKLFEADTIIYAVGHQALQEEADALRLCAPEFHQIGDCLKPDNIQHATRMAYNIASDI